MTWIGPDTPWRPGFVQGFHQMLDLLPRYLDGTWTAADVAEWIGARAQAGRLPPKGFPRSNRFA